MAFRVGQDPARPPPNLQTTAGDQEYHRWCLARPFPRDGRVRFLLPCVSRHLRLRPGLRVEGRHRDRGRRRGASGRALGWSAERAVRRGDGRAAAAAPSGLDISGPRRVDFDIVNKRNKFWIGPVSVAQSDPGPDRSVSGSDGWPSDHSVFPPNGCSRQRGKSLVNKEI
jgi:hypothetical protein